MPDHVTLNLTYVSCQLYHSLHTEFFLRTWKSTRRSLSIFCVSYKYLKIYFSLFSALRHDNQELREYVDKLVVYLMDKYPGALESSKMYRWSIQCEGGAWLVECVILYVSDWLISRCASHWLIYSSTMKNTRMWLVGRVKEFLMKAIHWFKMRTSCKR